MLTGVTLMLGWRWGFGGPHHALGAVPPFAIQLTCITWEPTDQSRLLLFSLAHLLSCSAGRPWADHPAATMRHVARVAVSQLCFSLLLSHLRFLR